MHQINPNEATTTAIKKATVLSVGNCPECGDKVIHEAEGFKCTQPNCTFSIAETAIATAISPEVVSLIPDLASVAAEDVQGMMADLLSTGESLLASQHFLDGETYFSLKLVKSASGWTVEMAHTDN